MMRTADLECPQLCIGLCCQLHYPQRNHPYEADSHRNVQVTPGTKYKAERVNAIYPVPFHLVSF